MRKYIKYIFCEGDLPKERKKEVRRKVIIRVGKTDSIIFLI